MDKVSYERRVYESEDYKSLPSDISQKWRKTVFMQQRVFIY